MRTFEQITQDIVELHSRKNADYGNAFQHTFEKFGLVAPVIRCYDKVSRLISLCRKNAQVKDESIKDTLTDLAAYAIMTIEAMEKLESNGTGKQDNLD